MIDRYNMYDVDKNLNLIAGAFQRIIKDISEEINQNGKTFSTTSQSLYRDRYEYFLNTNLFETLELKHDESKRKASFVQLLLIIQKYIEIYKKYEELFYSYDRRKLAYKNYKILRELPNDIKDKELLVRFKLEYMSVSGVNYIESDFYNQFGFLVNNYHEAIYLYAKCVKYSMVQGKPLAKEFNDKISFLKITEFIDDALLYFVHKHLSEILFEQISEYEFKSFFNLKNDFVEIEIKENQKTKLFGLIGKFYNEHIKNEFKEIWLNNILEKLNLSMNSFKSNYREYSKGSSGEKLIYKEKLESIFELYKTLNELSLM